METHPIRMIWVGQRSPSLCFALLALKIAWCIIHIAAILVVLKRISEAAEKERHAMMQTACDGTARRWGGFTKLTFYDAKWQTDETIKDLCKAIRGSTIEDPLWIIEAGEPDIIGFALEATPEDKHQFVKVVTHHPANDNAGDFYSWQDILDFGVEEVRIPDQNEYSKSGSPRMGVGHEP